MWLPSSAAQDPVPALLEYIPYRKNDFTALRDSVRHRYFAGHGYGSVRVDMRGSGDSDGVLLDEYLLQEQDDALEVIAWLAAQPWCTGHVGMFGKSWGGFNALQVAARRPPALKAIISLCSTDDRFETDIHYCGGLHMAADHVSWSAYMLAFNARPPDPAVVGESWRRKWLVSDARMFARATSCTDRAMTVDWLCRSASSALWTACAHGARELRVRVHLRVPGTVRCCPLL